MLLVLIVFPLVAGCQRYGEVSNQSYRYAGALLTACNLQSEERLDAVKSKIEGDSELSATESEWLLEIIDLAESGDWEDATGRARQMMDEQVGSIDQ